MIDSVFYLLAFFEGIIFISKKQKADKMSTPKESRIAKEEANLKV